MLSLLFILRLVSCLSREGSYVPLDSFQPAWQAGLPIPIQVSYDVPVSSFLQAAPPVPPPTHDKILGNNFVVRLHPPEESTATMIEDLDAVKYQEQVRIDLSSKQTSSQRHVLLDSVSKSIDGMVTDLMAP